MRAMTREQWFEYLSILANEKICASCWATQLKKYLTRFGMPNHVSMLVYKYVHACVISFGGALQV